MVTRVRVAYSVRGVRYPALDTHKRNGKGLWQDRHGLAIGLLQPTLAESSLSAARQPQRDSYALGYYGQSVEVTKPAASMAIAWSGVFIRRPAVISAAVSAGTAPSLSAM